MLTKGLSQHRRLNLNKTFSMSHNIAYKYDFMILNNSRYICPYKALYKGRYKTSCSLYELVKYF